MPISGAVQIEGEMVERLHLASARMKPSGAPGPSALDLLQR